MPHIYAERRSCKSLPDRFGMLRIHKLDLFGNELKEFPRVFDMPDLRYLSLSANTFGRLPPDIDRLADPQAVARILDYIVLPREGRRPLDEAKLLVVGEGSVGKSSIIRRLTLGDLDPDERTTEGIDVTRWDLDVGGPTSRSTSGTSAGRRRH